MRRNVLFVAKFDNVLKGINTILSKSFNMQMCPPELTMIDKMLGVVETDLILLFISGLPDMIWPGLCETLDSSNRSTKRIQTPIVVFGNADECREFEKFCPIPISKYVHRPVAVQDIVKAINEVLKLNSNAESDTESKAESSASQPQTKNSMSLADLADSLETDERRCILLVDDDGRILRAIKMLLEKTYRINLANSGMSALESIERERPDAVLLDYEMPVIDGKQTLEMIRQNKKTQDLPVFFLTGVADKERIRDVVHLKPQGYLLKSSEQNAILERLEEFFKGSDQ